MNALLAACAPSLADADNHSSADALTNITTDSESPANDKRLLNEKSPLRGLFGMREAA